MHCATSNTCFEFEGDPLHSLAGSSLTTTEVINKDWENHSKSLVACSDAQGVMKAFLRPGAKVPGTGRKGRKGGKKSGKSGKGRKGRKGGKMAGKPRSRAT